MNKLRISKIWIAVIVVAVVEVFFGFYGTVFFFRIMREIVGLTRSDAWLLMAFFYSMAYIMLTVMVPDQDQPDAALRALCDAVVPSLFDVAPLLDTVRL